MLLVKRLATYFNNKTPLVYAALLFLSLVLMFASYVVLSDKLINHHQISKGFMLMYSHIAIVVSVLLMTVDSLYLSNHSVKREFLFCLIIATIALYYVSLLVNLIYSKEAFRFKIREAAILLAIFIFGAIVLWFIRNSMIGIMTCLLIWNLAFFLVFLMKSKDSLN